MMRSAAKLFGATGAAASVGAPQTAHCRAQPAHLAVPTGRDGKGTSSIGNGWLMTDLQQALDSNDVIFEEAEIDETMDSLLGFKSHPKVKELSDSSSESGSEGVDLTIRAAEQQMAVYDPDAFQLRCVLSNLLHDKGVQSACLEALQRDPLFRKAIQSPYQEDLTFSNPLQIEEVTEPEETLGASGSGDEAHPVKKLVEDLAARLKIAGEGLKGKAIGFRDALGRFLIHMGASLHALLGQPFSATPIEESQNAKPEENSNRPKSEAVGYMLMTLAIAVLTIVLLKRVHPVKFG